MKLVLDDELWKLIEPILPPPKRRRRRFPGRKPKDNRSVLTGIIFVLKTGIGWEYLPQEMGCGSGMTCWRRLRDWQRRGVWDKIHKVLLDRLQEADKIDWSRAVVDSASVRAAFGGRKRAPIPRIAGKKAPNTTSSRMGTAFPSRPS
jgi:transposase